MKDYQDKWLKIDNELDLSNFLAFLELVLRKPKERNSNILEFMGCLDFKSQKEKKVNSCENENWMIIYIKAIICYISFLWIYSYKIEKTTPYCTIHCC